MKTNLKFTVGFFALTLAIFVGASMDSAFTVSGANSVKTCLDGYNSGVATLVDPTSCTTESEIKLVKEAEKPYELVMSKVNGTINVREEANEEALITGKLYRDCGAVVLEHKDDWTKIKSGNLIGWTKDENLYFGEEAKEEAFRVGYSIAVVKTDAIRVRAGASTEGPEIGYAAKDEKLVVVSVFDEQWLCVEYGDGLGYVLREHVSEEFMIDHGESMEEITERKTKEEKDRMKLVTNYGSLSATEYELTLLASIIYCEAGGESYEGKQAVGAVVCNRVRSSRYPDTLSGVIYASGQFTPAMTGKLDRVMERGNVPQSCYDAAKEALSGYTNVGDALYFRRNNGTRQGTVIGNHVFY